MSTYKSYGVWVWTYIYFEYAINWIDSSSARCSSIWNNVAKFTGNINQEANAHAQRSCVTRHTLNATELLWTLCKVPHYVCFEIKANYVERIMKIKKTTFITNVMSNIWYYYFDNFNQNIQNRIKLKINNITTRQTETQTTLK